MPTHHTANKLTEMRYVALILRLVLDSRGRLVQGELVDASAAPLGRFVGWRGLSRLLRSWLASQEQDAPTRTPPEHCQEGANAPQ